jgi:hypothetical protein
MRISLGALSRRMDTRGVATTTTTVTEKHHNWTSESCLFVSSPTTTVISTTTAATTVATTSSSSWSFAHDFFIVDGQRPDDTVDVCVGVAPPLLKTFPWPTQAVPSLYSPPHSTTFFGLLYTFFTRPGQEWRGLCRCCYYCWRELDVVLTKHITRNHFRGEHFVQAAWSRTRYLLLPAFGVVLSSIWSFPNCLLSPCYGRFFNVSIKRMTAMHLCIVPVR